MKWVSNLFIAASAPFSAAAAKRMDLSCERDSAKAPVYFASFVPRGVHTPPELPDLRMLRCLNTVQHPHREVASTASEIVLICASQPAGAHRPCEPAFEKS